MQITLCSSWNDLTKKIMPFSPNHLKHYKLNASCELRSLALYLIVLATVVLAPAHKSAADTTTKLPPESQHLLSRLHEYETREKKKLDYTLNKKRQEVLVILRKHFKKCTQNNQLDKALAIRKEIDRLEALMTKDLPQRLYPTNKIFEVQGKVVPPSKVVTYFGIDADGSEGRVILEFKHPQLAKLFNSFKTVQIEIKVSTYETSESKDLIVIKHKNKVIGKQLGAKKGETLKIKLDTWKILRIKDEVKLSIECAGNDGFIVETNTKDGFASLTFGNR